MISILIIGNEILSGQVEDTNLRHMLRRFKEVGYRIDEVRLVRDDIKIISRAIRQLSQGSRYLISTGGIGPTHDDVTLAAYAHAFGQELQLHPDLAARIRTHYGDAANEVHLRLARLPAKTKLVYTTKLKWPIIQVENCFVLPGLPEIFLLKFAGVLEILPKPVDQYYAEILTNLEEADFAEPLNQAQHRFPSVEIGSYPTFDRSKFSARITFKGEDLQQLTEVFSEIKDFMLEADALVGAGDPARANWGSTT